MSSLFQLLLSRHGHSIQKSKTFSMRPALYHLQPVGSFVAYLSFVVSQKENLGRNLFVNGTLFQPCGENKAISGENKAIILQAWSLPIWGRKKYEDRKFILLISSWPSTIVITVSTDAQAPLMVLGHQQPQWWITSLTHWGLVTQMWLN